MKDNTLELAIIRAIINDSANIDIEDAKKQENVI